VKTFLAIIGAIVLLPIVLICALLVLGLGGGMIALGLAIIAFFLSFVLPALLIIMVLGAVGIMILGLMN
jgi:hypothetical protein